MPRNSTERLDVLVAEAGLAESREDAQRLIRAGLILVNEERIDKPGRKVDREAVLRSKAKPRPFVSRAGEKLAAALEAWDITINDFVCLDLGASTGGFCDCLLQRGAARIHAVDVGAGQLHEKLRTDSRIVIHDKTNARLLKPDSIGEPVQLVTADLSFISLRLVLPVVRDMVADGGFAIVLVKPQFEIGKGRVGKGGIVRDPKDHREVLTDFAAWILEQGWGIKNLMPSPILGREGNREFLAQIVFDRTSGLGRLELQETIESCVYGTTDRV